MLARFQVTQSSALPSLHFSIVVGSDITEEAIEKIVRAQWQKVDDLIDKYKKKCEQAKVKFESGFIVTGYLKCTRQGTSFAIQGQKGRKIGRAEGVQGWRSGESTRLPPMWPGFDSQIRPQMWVEFVGSLLCTEVFSGNSGFPSPQKPKFESDLIVLIVNLIYSVPN